MASLSGRVAVVTGAGRGIGREHALFLAAEGAKVVVNDLGVSADGSDADVRPAEEVAALIRDSGGEAVANFDDASDWDGAHRLVRQAIDSFGDLHVLVNNAGIIRDRMLVNMAVEDWDAVMRVHLRGTFCPTRAASGYWREQSKAGVTTDRAVINTSSTSGLFGGIGQANYGTAKLGIAAFTAIAAAELSRYSVRVNAIAPVALTRLTESLHPELAHQDGSGWFPRHPGNVSPFVGYLATDECPITGRVFLVYGGEVQLFHPFAVVDKISKDGKWTLEELKTEAPRLQEVPFTVNNPFIDRLQPQVTT